MPIPRWLAFLSLAAFVAACAPASDNGPDFAVRDSAGVEIVESNVAAWGEEARWSVDSTPILVIGQEEGEDAHMLSIVRGALRFDDDSIVIADGSTRQLRLFDSNGQFLRAAGRRGPGPGEFRTLERIARCGRDEVWVDAGNRVSIWGTDLQFRREFAIPEDIMWPLVCFDGAGVVVKRDAPGKERTSSDFIGSALVLTIRDSLGQDPREFMRIELRQRIEIPNGNGMVSLVHPFGAVTVLAAQGADVAVGPARSLEVRTYRRDGTLRRIARGPDQDLRITDSIRSEYAKAELTGWPGEERRLLGLVGTPMPDSYPAYTALLTDREGNLWAQRFSASGPAGVQWGVFATDGRFLGHVRLPRGLEAYEIGSDYVLGKARDSLGVEQVRMYRLRR